MIFTKQVRLLIPDDLRIVASKPNLTLILVILMRQVKTKHVFLDDALIKQSGHQSGIGMVGRGIRSQTHQSIRNQLFQILSLVHDKELKRLDYLV